MPTDFTSFESKEGKTCAIDTEHAADAVKVSHHGEVGVEPQSRYDQLQFETSIGSGPWRRFLDRESEAAMTIDSRRITGVREVG